MTFSVFFSETLSSLAAFLGTEPVIYFMGLFLLCYVIKCIKTLIS